MTTFTTITDFTPDKFTPKKWDTPETKAAFAQQFIKFVQSDFARTKFPKWFYQRLSMTFGHIAHFNQHGFFETFFTTTQDKHRFLVRTLQHSCHGDPAWTYSDVERALQSWLLNSGIPAKYERRLAQETEAAERAELTRLQAKYGAGSA